MKVAVVTQYPLNPEAPQGGVEAVSVNLVRALARRDGLEVQVVTTDDAIREPVVDQVEGVTRHRLPGGGGSLLARAVGSGRRQMIAYLLGLRPDVVHAHDVYGLMVRGLRLPRVFTIHGFIHADTRLSGDRLPRVRSWIWRWFELAGWRDQTDIISISPYVRERLTGVVKARIHDIENPVAEAFFDLAPKALPTAHILCAAVVGIRKNTLGLIEGFARLRARGIDARLRLAGSVREPDYGREVEERIRTLGLAAHVDLLGPVSSPRIREELTQAKAFVLVSLEENSPMGIEEAMAAGVPVVTSNRCGMPYMVRDGESGYLVDPHDPGELADRLAQILQSDELHRKFSARSRQIARERFHPLAVAERTEAVYRHLKRAPPLEQE